MIEARNINSSIIARTSTAGSAAANVHLARLFDADLQCFHASSLTVIGANAASRPFPCEPRVAFAWIAGPKYAANPMNVNGWISRDCSSIIVLFAKATTRAKPGEFAKLTTFPLTTISYSRIAETSVQLFSTYEPLQSIKLIEPVFIDSASGEGALRARGKPTNEYTTGLPPPEPYVDDRSFNMLSVMSHLRLTQAVEASPGAWTFAVHEPLHCTFKLIASPEAYASPTALAAGLWAIYRCGWYTPEKPRGSSGDKEMFKWVLLLRVVSRTVEARCSNGPSMSTSAVARLAIFSRPTKRPARRLLMTARGKLWPASHSSSRSRIVLPSTALFHHAIGAACASAPYSALLEIAVAIARYTVG